MLNKLEGIVEFFGQYSKSLSNCPPSSTRIHPSLYPPPHAYHVPLPACMRLECVRS